MRGVVAGTSTVTTTYIGAYFEWVSPGTAVKYYYLGGKRVAMRDGEGDEHLFFLLGDHLGSTSVAYPADGGQAVTQRYSAWGAVRPGPGNELPTDYTYTGQRVVESVGLLYYGARWYDGSLGRLTQPDSAVPAPEDPQSLNRYSYARNEPLNHSDPTGHVPEPVFFFLYALGFHVGSGLEYARQLGALDSDQVYYLPPTTVDGESPLVLGNPEAMDPEAVLNAGHQVGTAAALIGGHAYDAIGAAVAQAQILFTPAPPSEAGEAGRAAAEVGSALHYDRLNGGIGQGLPSQLQDTYKDTQFEFTPRGASGVDVTVVGGKKPWEYSGSTWPEGFLHGDFKPDTPSGWNTFYAQWYKGKLPVDTTCLSYDPETGMLVR